MSLTLYTVLALSFVNVVKYLHICLVAGLKLIVLCEN